MSNFVTDGENNQSIPPGSNSFSRWIKFLIRPSKAGFESIRDIASTPRTLIGFAIVWGLQAVIGLVADIRGPVELTGALIALLSPILLVIGYYVLQIIIWASAKILGGTGKYIEQSNLIALTAIPVAIVSALFGFAITHLPFYGYILISMSFQLYYCVTIALALQAVHVLSATKAWLIAITFVVFYALYTAAVGMLPLAMFLTYLVPF